MSNKCFHDGRQLQCYRSPWGNGLSHSLSLTFSMSSATEVQLSSPSMSFTCPCVTARLQCASLFLWEVSEGFQRVGDDFCLAPHLSVAYLNHAHSYHPSHCPPISLSLSLSLLSHAANMSLLHLALPCFTLSSKQRHISQSVAQMTTDRESQHLLS